MKRTLHIRSSGLPKTAHSHLRKRRLRLSLGQLAQYMLDMVVLAAMFALAYYIRFDFGTSDDARVSATGKEPQTTP